VSLVLFGGLAGNALAQDFSHDDPNPPFDIDWSVGLRGGYTSDNRVGGLPDIVLAPEVIFVREGAFDRTELATGGAVALEGDGTLRLDDFHARAKSALRLDRVTTLEGRIDLSLTRASADDPSLPDDTSVAPQMATGTAEITASRQFGHFEVAARAKGQRFVEGETVLAGGGAIDNTGQNYWQGAAGLRVGYAVTPLLTVFADGLDGYQKFDIAAPGLGRFLDGRTMVLRAGIDWGRDELVSAEISAGRAYLDFTDAGLTDRAAWVFGASASFRPDPTLTLTAELDSSIAPSSTVAGDVDFNTSLGATARYLVNPWLTLRGSAGWNRADTLGTGDVATGYGAGVGIDYRSTRQLSWNADYLYAHTDPVGGDSRDSQRVTVGATVRR
jgi:hypothetical protein